jgi:Ni,Fe-hydrogenase III large subunit
MKLLEGLPIAPAIGRGDEQERQDDQDDPGVQRELLDDDLVRPTAEEDLVRTAARGARSPLARHVVLPVTPLDTASPLGVGLRLSVEGVRITEATIEAGFLHQGLERRTVGRSIDDVDVWRLVGRADPAALPQIGLSMALERLAGIHVPERARALRLVVVDLVALQEALWVLGSSAEQAPRLTRAATAVARDVNALFWGIVEGDTLAAVGGLRRDLHADERAALLRLVPGAARALDSLDLRELEAMTGVGRLSRSIARAQGVDGAVGRAVGLADDTPCDLAFEGAANAEHPIDGCTWSRLCVRLADARCAAARLEKNLHDLPDGPVRSTARVPRRDGVAHAVLRGPSGSWSVLVAVHDGRFVRVRLRPPELALLGAIPVALEGVALNDAATVVASFGLRATALDR